MNLLFPANIIEQKVGANSNIIDRLVAKPINIFGINGSLIFRAVCNAITPPMKNEMKAIIPIDF